MLFLLVFLLNFGGFLPIDIYGFFLSFSLDLEDFFFIKAIISNTYTIVKACTKEGRCNIIKSCDQSHDGFNQIGTISDHY